MRIGSVFLAGAILATLCNCDNQEYLEPIHDKEKIYGIESFTFMPNQDGSSASLVTELSRCDQDDDHNHTSPDVLENENFESLYTEIIKYRRIFDNKSRKGFIGKKGKYHKLAKDSLGMLNEYEFGEGLVFTFDKTDFFQDSVQFQYRFDNPVIGYPSFSIKNNKVIISFLAKSAAMNCEEIPHPIHLSGHVCDPRSGPCGS